MITISLCMIVRDEEDVLDRCLRSVKDLVDEIVIVDTGSLDKTKEIASAYTDRIYDFQWIDDFSAARNYAFSLAKMDYSMWLDADDILTKENQINFCQLKETLSTSVSVVMMPYHTGFDDQGNVTCSYYRERIIKNGFDMKWIGAVHEVIQPIGEVFYSNCAIRHEKLRPSNPDRNLRIFEKLIEQGTPLDTRQQFYYGRELYYHQRYTDALEVFQHFLNEGVGWLENSIDACCHCAYCHYALGNENDALQDLLRTLSMDLPRAEVCCDIGRHFFDRKNWRQAAFWYTLATTCCRDDRRGGFTSPDCYGYLPCIQLCVCYSQLGHLEKAIRFNELAGEFKPDSEVVLQNRKYFSTLTNNPTSEN